MAWVKNKGTGLVHQVPENHWAIGDAGYEQTEDPNAPTPKPKTAKTQPQPAE